MKFIKQNSVASRTVEVRGDQTLEDLPQAIFNAFAREDEHMYEFQICGKGPMEKPPFPLWPFAFRLMPLAYQLCLPRETRKMFHWGAALSLPPLRYALCPMRHVHPVQCEAYCTGALCSLP